MAGGMCSTRRPSLRSSAGSAGPPPPYCPIGRIAFRAQLTDLYLSWRELLDWNLQLALHIVFLDIENLFHPPGLW